MCVYMNTWCCPWGMCMQRLLTQHSLTECVECDAKVWGGVQGVGDAIDRIMLPVDSAIRHPAHLHAGQPPLR